MENNPQPSLVKVSATYGSILGIIVVIYSVLLYIFDVMPVGIVKPIVLGLISILLYIIGVVFFAKKVRNTYFPDAFPFGKAFVTCLIIAVVAILISTVYSYIQTTVIDPDYFARIMQAQKDYFTEFFTNRGLPEDQLQIALDRIDEQSINHNPVKSVITGFFVSVAISAIVSLIIAAAIKRNPKIFE